MLKKIFLSLCVLLLIAVGIIYYLNKKGILKNYLLDKVNVWLAEKYNLTFTYDSLNIAPTHYTLNQVELYMGDRELIAFKTVFISNRIVDKKINLDIVVANSYFPLKSIQNTYEQFKTIKKNRKNNLSDHDRQKTGENQSNFVNRNHNLFKLRRVDLIGDVRFYLQNCSTTITKKKTILNGIYDQSLKGNVELDKNKHRIDFLLDPKQKTLSLLANIHKNEFEIKAFFKYQIEPEMHLDFESKQSYLKFNTSKYKKVTYRIGDKSEIHFDENQIQYSLYFFNRETIFIEGKTDLTSPFQIDKSLLSRSRIKAKVRKLIYRDIKFEDLLLDLENNIIRISSQSTAYQNPIPITSTLQIPSNVPFNYRLRYHLTRDKEILGNVAIPHLEIKEKTHHKRGSKNNRKITKDSPHSDNNRESWISLKNLNFIRKNLSGFDINIDVPTIEYIEKLTIKQNKIHLTSFSYYKIKGKWENESLKFNELKWHFNNNDTAFSFNLLTQTPMFKQTTLHLEEHSILIESQYNEDDHIFTANYYVPNITFKTLNNTFLSTVKGRGNFTVKGDVKYSLKDKKMLSSPSFFFTNISKSILIRNTPIQNKVWSLPIISENKSRNEDIFHTVSGNISLDLKKNDDNVTLIKDLSMLTDNYGVLLKKSEWKNKNNHYLKISILLNDYFKEEYVTVPIDYLSRFVKNQKIIVKSNNEKLPYLFNFAVANNQIKINY